MVKRFFVLLMLLLSALAVTGCGGGGGNDSGNPAPIITDPITITPLSLVELDPILTGDAQDVIAAGNKLYYIGRNDSGNSFGIIDFTDPTNPEILSTLDVGEAWGLAFDGRYAFVETDGRGDGILATGTVGVIDCLDPLLPVVKIADASGHSLAYDMEISGDYLYNFSDNIIGVYNISAPENIVHVQNVNVVSAEFGKIVGNYLYTGDNFSSDLVIHDISAPTGQIPEVGRLHIDSAGHAATASGTTAFIAGIDGAEDVIYSVDVSDPTNPAIIKSVVTPSYIGNEMRILGHYLLAVGNDDFVVIDIADPENMTVVGSVTLGNSLGWGFDVSGRYAIIADDTVLRIIQLY
ncbi:MAG: hypothetical protein U1D97_07420 [Desulfuromonadales bacterium]|nr:hypothetical protein [Desulfuromonadales bacterium]